MKLGRFIIDTHFHAQRHAAGPELRREGGGQASQPTYTHIGAHPQTYTMQVRSEGIVTHQVDIMGWSLKQVSRLDISQDDLNLILGGNALRIYKIDFPLTRMFKPVALLQSEAAIN